LRHELARVPCPIPEERATTQLILHGQAENMEAPQPDIEMSSKGSLHDPKLHRHRNKAELGFTRETIPTAATNLCQSDLSLQMLGPIILSKNSQGRPVVAVRVPCYLDLCLRSASLVGFGDLRRLTISGSVSPPDKVIQTISGRRQQTVWEGRDVGSLVRARCLLERHSD
jgi:hypothetical protein